MYEGNWHFLYEILLLGYFSFTFTILRLLVRYSILLVGQVIQLEPHFILGQNPLTFKLIFVKKLSYIRGPFFHHGFHFLYFNIENSVKIYISWPIHIHLPSIPSLLRWKLQ
jgi:hypothetical protein